MIVCMLVCVCLYESTLSDICIEVYLTDSPEDDLMLILFYLISSHSYLTLSCTYTNTCLYRFSLWYFYVQCDLVSSKLKEGLSLIRVVDEVRKLDLSLACLRHPPIFFRFIWIHFVLSHFNNFSCLFFDSLFFVCAHLFSLNSFFDI